ncbi:DUF2513 domain-containing protein [Hoeflea sp. YIM 152468]|uniref:DUF2513 domain-containing protein n=1 Tax=Hoeflea sp. YIM 152468 TaxID=3031759 RepID=UPI0023DC4059|nr:DUF2513 domain-containing protein [Hoeflea sp. YIM 152468]MDF1608414.1 DUF2513 domain-containing protein [Hoeflea sp. YIM 152468]
MKRDMDLIRLILLEIEEKDSGSGQTITIGDIGHPSEVVTEHLFMLKNAGFIEGIDASHMQGRHMLVQRLTWNGHEFLNTVRDPEVWAKTKKGADKVGAFSIEVLSEIAKGIIRKKVADLSGIEIDL